MPHLQEHCWRNRSQSLKKQEVLLEVRVDFCFRDRAIPERKRKLGDVLVGELGWRVREKIAVLVGVQGFCKRGQVFAVELERQREGDNQLVHTIKELDERWNSLLIWSSQSISKWVAKPDKLLGHEGLEPFDCPETRAQEQLRQDAYLRWSIRAVCALDENRIPVLHLQCDLFGIKQQLCYLLEPLWLFDYIDPLHTGVTLVGRGELIEALPHQK